MSKNLFLNDFFKQGKIVGLILIAIVFLLLSASNLTAKSVIYVDDDAFGEMDGSKNHPYKKIQDAIDKAKKENKDVKILKGEYKENFKILSGVEVFGEGSDETIIRAKDKNEPVVRMKNDTALRKVTVREGSVGVSVGENYLAVISDCQIIKNHKNGVEAKASKTHNDEKLTVLNSYIAENGKGGIYAVSKKVDIQDNLIYKNEGNGIALEGGCEGSLKRNKSKDNDGDGMWVVLDWSELYLDNNTFYDNDREGLEVRSNGNLGLVEITDSKFYKNNKWGVARLETKNFSDANWNKSLIFGKGNLFWENKSGDISYFYNVK